MEGIDFLDLPIVAAIDYFQGVSKWFLMFATTYGNFFGMLGLVWTGIRLVNSRIDMRSAFWDSLSKWFVFLLLINFYYAGTTVIGEIANSVGINAGGGKNIIVSNFKNLKTRIEADLQLEKQWSKGLTDLYNAELGVELDYIKADDDDIDAYVKTLKNFQKKYEWNSKQQKDAFNKKLSAYKKNRPEKEKTIYGAKTLKALKSVLVYGNTEGEKTDLTGAYVVSEPELDIWLRDSNKERTNYFSAAALIRIGCLICEIIWEKSSMQVIVQEDEYGNETYTVKEYSKFSLEKFRAMFFAIICCLGIMASIIFATIQYVMCILEFTIIQGIGAGFIPLYLFDGTKDMPKKLVPVFTGFIIKILVMVICLMFVISLYLNFAAAQISPESGSLNTFSAVFECFFIVLLSFILTSNAPKIAMTLLTGQPQLSMGEFMAGLGAIAGVGAVAKNTAGTIASPAAALAKKKAHDWSERTAAGKAGEQKQRSEMKNQFASAHGIDTSTKAGQKNLDKKWKIYSESSDRKDEINDKIKTAGKNARSETKQQQKTEDRKHGGVLGETGRMIAHYSGAVLNPKDTLMRGRVYNTPQSNLDVNRIGGDSLVNPDIKGRANKDDNIKKEDSKNGVSESEIEGIGTSRKSEMTDK
ncbi:MAG: type IV secretion system protein [Bacteroides sp.]|nr:type IV secretion system protein [Prevotella sp.]MCM1407036.1 type IV secretion system protein [Treponema brennaborense]MCM1470188.1 type IV secretion system protein [Bacteroides sp.]